MLSTIIPFPTLNLSLIGLLFLAPFTTLSAHRILKGAHSSWLSFLILCPGLHTLQSAHTLSEFEFPACAAMTTGYVFRVENQATTYYLQKVGRTGLLTTLSVSSVGEPGDTPMVQKMAYGALMLLSVSAVTVSKALGDTSTLASLLFLLASHLISDWILRRRASVTWSGQHEPGVKGDLLVLLSRDRWVRLQGFVDDLKAVTSGEWLRDATGLEQLVANAAVVLVYLAVILASNASSQTGQLMIGMLMVVELALLELLNASMTEMSMKGRTVQVVGRRKYERRLVMAEELVEEVGRDDWALRMGMINESILNKMGNKGNAANNAAVVKDVIM